jgi:hypothetical protein
MLQEIVGVQARERPAAQFAAFGEFPYSSYKN